MLTIRYQIRKTIFGAVLLAFTKGKLCYLAFVCDTEERAILCLQNKLSRYGVADLKRDNTIDGAKILAAFMAETADSIALDCTVLGTAFQRKVWDALRLIPRGEIKSYQAVAAMLGRPQAYRSVASAVAANNIALFIPCHRVVLKSGDVGQYAWGSDLKLRLLQHEGAMR